MKRFAGIVLLIILFARAGANDLESLVSQGNDHYLKGEYELAVQVYQAVVDSGYSSAELYYNLGNAYYKSNNITLALVNYERAYILDPKDADIRNNLDVAREFVVDRIEVLPEFFLKTAWYGFVKVFDADVWAIMSIVTFLLALALFLVYFLSGRLGIRRFSFWIALIMLFLSLSTLLFAGQQEKLITRHNLAIVSTPSVSIKSSPDDNSGTDLFLLHEGTRVRVADELGDWREVVLSDGNRGWLKESDLILLYMPPSSK